MLNQRIENSIYGRLMVLDNGIISITVTLDIGIRILRFSLVGEESVFYEDNDNITKSGEYFDKTFGEGKKWRIIGGHRLWVSPETLSSYSLDDKPVYYCLTAKGVILQSSVETHTQLVKKIEISLNKNEVSLVETIANMGEDKEIAAWGLSVLRAGGELIVPLNDRIDDITPQQNLVRWQYTDIKDSRFELADEFAYLRQSQIKVNPFKVGMLLKKGVAGYYIDGTLFMKKFEAKEDANYPDYGCNFETYTNSYMLECEVLSPLKKIKKNSWIMLRESWSLTKMERKNVENFLKNA